MGRKPRRRQPCPTKRDGPAFAAVTSVWDHTWLGSTFLDGCRSVRRSSALVPLGAVAALACCIGKLSPKLGRLVRLPERIVGCHQIFARIHQPAHARISLLGQDLVPGERLSHRFPVAALAQQRATQFDPRNAGVQVLGSLTLREDFDRLPVQRLGHVRSVRRRSCNGSGRKTLVESRAPGGSTVLLPYNAPTLAARRRG